MLRMVADWQRKHLMKLLTSWVGDGSLLAVHNPNTYSNVCPTVSKTSR